MIVNRPVETRRMGWLSAALIVAMPLVLGGCNAVVLDPAGYVALQQRNLLIIATVLMLLIIVPVMILTALFAWRYRASNEDAIYEPDWDHSTKLELLIWAAPLLIIICLGAITWTGTHVLDPYRPLGRIDSLRTVDAAKPPLEVEVVALDWKWLFIYPQYGIATVNQMAAPVDRPISFKITSSAIMNSFFVPALAGQIYAMPGMETSLHAVMNKPGNFHGFSANYSGAGFSGMDFRFLSMNDGDFDQWVSRVKASGMNLTKANYLKLEQPSENVKPMFFGDVAPDLYARILNICVRPGEVCMATQMDHAHEGAVVAPVNNNNSDRAEGALMRSPEEKGTSPNVDVKRKPHPPGNAAPGNQANRNLSALDHLPILKAGAPRRAAA